MTATTPTVESLAAEVNAALVRDERDDGTKFVKFADGSPDWMTDLSRAAHGDMMPDDWRYEFIEDAVSALENGDEEPNDVDSAYPYTADRLRWLGSHSDRPGYCDEEAEEYSMESTGILTLIALGMGREMRETFDLVKSFLEGRVEELTTESDDE